MNEAQIEARKKRLKSAGRVLATPAPPEPQKPRQQRKNAHSAQSNGEFALAAQLAGVPGWEREYRFDPKRRWRFDVAFPDKRLGVEVEGGQWISGRHNRGTGFQGDLDKYNAATMQGWAVLRFSTEQALNGFAYETIMEYLSRVKWL